MLLLLQKRQPAIKPAGATYVAPVPNGPVSEAPRGRSSTAGRQFEPARQMDFGTVVNTQDAQFPVVSRYRPVPIVQRQTPTTTARSYPNIYSRFTYPAPIEAPRGRSNTAGRTFEPATQTDFAL